MMHDNPHNWLRNTILETGFLETYPYFAPVLALIDVVAYEQEGLMAVSLHEGRVRLHVNITAFEENLSGFRGVLQHELHHIVLDHVTDPSLKQVAEPAIMQVATEVTANEFITEPLPGDPYLLSSYATYGFRPGQSTRQRYDLLLQAYRDGRYKPPAKIVGHCCGVGDDDAETHPHDMADFAREILERLKQSQSNTPHPAREEQVADAAGRSAIDWATELRRFALGRPEREQTLRRPSRLDPHCERIGELPGRCRRPGRPKLVVAIDTSSSMDTDLFPRIGDELRAIARRADLVIVECDNEIRREYPYENELKSVRGRGGTDLCRVFEPECLDRHRPDGIVYFTDGDGPYPDRNPGLRTLWVLTTGEEFACTWGARVHMSTRNRRTASRHRGRMRIAELVKISREEGHRASWAARSLSRRRTGRSKRT
jgi:predicted metal-dependent peptidase